MTAREEQVFAIVKAAMCEVVAEPWVRDEVERLSMDTAIDSLEVDSMAKMLIIASIEDRTGLLLEDDQLLNLRSIGEMVRQLAKLMTEAAA